MVSNAYTHALSSVRIWVEYRGEVLRVEVADDSPVLPQLREESLDATGGRGIMILDALAAAWGVRIADPGKVVWFDVAR